MCLRISSSLNLSQVSITKQVTRLVEDARRHAEERADREVHRLEAALAAQRAEYASLEREFRAGLAHEEAR